MHNDEFCIQNDEFCVETDEFCVETDELQGPKALAALLFGKENRWGKLPITIYDKDYSSKLKIQVRLKVLYMPRD